MKRRDLLAQSIEAALLVSLGGPAILAAERRGAAGQASRRPSALNPVSEYAKSYVPPTRVLDLSRRQILTLDIIGWRTDKRRQVVSTPNLGRITVKREPVEAAIEYDVTQQLGNDETMTGRFRCLTDRWHSLVAWQVESALASKRRDLASLSRTRQSGRREGDKLIMVADGAETVLPISGPLLCRYGLLDLAPQMTRLGEAGGTFALLQEPTGLRLDQRFREDRRGVLGRGGDAPIRTFLQTGPGTVPTHWVVDSQGRPLFVSAFLTSWALRAIS